MKNKRRSFQDLPAHENPQFSEDGIEIYRKLREKYPSNSDEDLDDILNGICAALVVMVRNNVEKSNYFSILQLIYKILHKNLS